MRLLYGEQVGVTSAATIGKKAVISAQSGVSNPWKGEKVILGAQQRI